MALPTYGCTANPGKANAPPMKKAHWTITILILTPPAAADTLTIPVFRRRAAHSRLQQQRLRLITKYSTRPPIKTLHPRQIPLPSIPTTTTTTTPPPPTTPPTTTTPNITYRGQNDGNGGVIGLQKILNFQADLEYFASIFIGTPPQLLNVILDTGSSDLWIASANCSVANGCSLGLGPRFDPLNSSSASTANSPFAIKYGSGSATGKMYSDNITFAGYKLPPQSFAVVDTVSSELLSRDVSGLMGLGFQPLASSGVTPIWQSLMNNGSQSGGNVSFAGFSFGLTRYINSSRPGEVEPGGLFTLGTLNASLIAPGEPISFVPVPNGLQSYWLIPLDGIDVNGTPLNLNAQASPNVAIDTGTTLIGGPANEVKQFYSQVSGSSPASGSYQGYYSYPCNSSVLVTFRFGGKNYSMAPDDFNLGPFGSNGRCLGSVFELELSGASRSLISWVIGDSFLKNVLSVYRYVPPAVGFARLSTAFNSSGPSVVTPGGPLWTPGLLHTVEAPPRAAPRTRRRRARAAGLVAGLRNGLNGSLQAPADPAAAPRQGRRPVCPSAPIPARAPRRPRRRALPLTISLHPSSYTHPARPASAPRRPHIPPPPLRQPIPTRLCIYRRLYRAGGPVIVCVGYPPS
ncbi:hypothetical protein PTTG_26790 [Puccinia triticina 1-1 BBBD Race 1]|uniref:Peptidase A1 domain-containing protein n=1 Tax=Puccinia triticina (isolate 1-1 / race 1 (BBBD)) TaxID=630390 RepID=A0A180GSV1_PUCT1|nr:hypothetical protein PTTG_26790 [Puccinia triticina 1-1 BBBD Race 1]